jgi:hypothetical protein
MSAPGKGFAKRITKDNIKEFKPLLRQNNEPSADETEADNKTKNSGESVPINPNFTKAESLFSGTPIKIANPFSASATSSASSNSESEGKAEVKTGTAFIPETPETGIAASIVTQHAKGILRWSKVLSKTDAQRQTGNVTGDLRLTQAKFKVGGVVIDQTTYFRNTVFSIGKWQIERQHPRVDIGYFDFQVIILGVNYGTYKLEVSHKPSGEAGQGNYTTGIRWGSIRRILESEVNVTKKVLNLYSPPVGQNSPFTIEIL